MVARPSRDLHHPTLFENLPGWRHQIDPTSYRLLHLEKLLELVDPLHRVVGMGRSLGDLDEGACKGEFSMIGVSSVQIWRESCKFREGGLLTGEGPSTGI